MLEPLLLAVPSQPATSCINRVQPIAVLLYNAEACAHLLSTLRLCMHCSTAASACPNLVSLVFASELAHAESLASSNEYHPQAAQYSTVLLKTSAIYHNVIWYHMISIPHVDSDS